MSDADTITLGRTSPRESLILRRAMMTRRVDALFRAMATDFLLREQFVTNPAQIGSEYLYGARISPERASIINQLLYAVMANRRLVSWLRQYAVTHRGDPPSGERFIRDFSQALVEHEAQHVVFALIRSSVELEGLLTVDEPLLQTIFGGGRIFSDDDGTGGAEGTGPGTGPDTGTDSGGTEMSTGTDSGGTEMSTGTAATEHSFGIFGSGYFAITLDALAQFATQLRDAGALDTIGFAAVTIPKSAG
jgi:hypothetical protein